MSLFGQKELRQLGHSIRRAREQGGMSQSQLAEKSALSTRAVRELEAGRTNPSLATMVAIVDALSLSLDELIRNAQAGQATVDLTPAADISPGVTGLTHTLAEPRLSATMLDIDASRSVVLPEGPIFAHVLSGQAQVLLDEERMVLRHGDSLHARSGVLKDLKAQGGRARILAVEALGLNQ
nr:helix-turn-helix domain-containing protein [Nitratireductor mangrovi]